MFAVVILYLLVSHITLSPCPFIYRILKRFHFLPFWFYVCKIYFCKVFRVILNFQILLYAWNLIIACFFVVINSFCSICQRFNYFLFKWYLYSWIKNLNIDQYVLVFCWLMYCRIMVYCNQSSESGIFFPWQLNVSYFLYEIVSIFLHHNSKL